MKTSQEHYYSNIVTKKRQTKRCRIIDIGGKVEEFILEESISYAHGFILVFAVNDKESFQILKTYIEKIEKENNGILSIPKILVGNKSDLKNERIISKEEAEAYSKEIEASYYEYSALEDEKQNCKIFFEECVNKILKINNELDENACCECLIS